MKALRFWILALVALCVGCPAGTSAPLGRPDAGPVSVPSAAPSAEPVTEEEALTRVMPSALPVAAPPPKETRTAAQLAQAACTGPGGKWLCSRVKPPPQVMAFGSNPIQPIAWSVPAWFVDIANVSGNASDGNACTTSGAPCLTKAEIIYHRWGTPSPTINGVNVVITYLSSDTTDNDPGVFTPTFINSGTLTHTTPLPAASFTGTLLVVTAKAVATNQPLTSTFTTTTGAIATKMLLVNATHPSRAWAIRNTAGGTWLISQPFVAYAGTGFPIFTEVDTWANGDAVSGYALTRVLLSKIGGTTSGITGAFTPSHIVQQLDIFQPVNGVLIADQNAWFVVIECSSSFSLSAGNAYNGVTPNIVGNSNFFLADISSLGPPATVSLSIVGGAEFSFHGVNMFVGTDTILGHHGILAGGNYGIGSIYMEPTTGGDLQISGLALMSSGTLYGSSGALTVAGGELDIIGATAVTRLAIPTLYLGHFGAPTSGYSNLTTAGVAVVHLVGSLTPAAIDAAAGAAGFGGYAYGGGGTISKVGAQP